MISFVSITRISLTNFNSYGWLFCLKSFTLYGNLSFAHTSYISDVSDDLMSNDW